VVRWTVATLAHRDAVGLGAVHPIKLETLGAWVMAGAFWLDEAQWAVIEPLLPTNQPGAARQDDRRIISGIIHVLKVGCRWQDCPAIYGPATTIYNRFNRWAARGIWRKLLPRWSRPRRTESR
jgi:transposase